MIACALFNFLLSEEGKEEEKEEDEEEKKEKEKEKERKRRRAREIGVAMKQFYAPYTDYYSQLAKSSVPKRVKYSRTE